MADIFLSYASQDRERARAFVDLLEGRGWSVWWDREILPGTPFDRMIDQAIQNASCVVVLFTGASLKSTWVSAEALDGLERGILVPVLLEDVRVPVAFRASQLAQMQGWPGKSQPADLARLFDAIQSVITSSAPLLRSETAVEVKPANPEFSSLAVLPFENLTGDADNDYLSEGLSDEVRSDLAQFRELRLVAGSSCYYFRDRSHDPRTIGQMLDVRHVVEGRVRRKPDGFRLMVEITDTTNGYQTYSKSFDFQADTIAEVQSVLVQDLRGIALPDVESTATKFEPDPEAYRSYLQGVFHFNNADTISRHRAISYFNKATELDPDFGDAYSGLSWSWSLRSIGSNEPVKPSKSLQESRVAAERALALTPDSPVALGAMGAVHMLAFDWEGAEHFTRRALEMQPQQTATRYVFCSVLTVHGQLQEAIDYMEGTLRYEPLSPIASNGLARLLRYAGRYREAEEACMRLLSAVPNSIAGLVGATNASVLTGDVQVIAERIEAEEKVLGEDSPTVLFHKTRLAAIEGDMGRIQRLYQQMLQLHRAAYINSSVMGITALMSGDLDACADWIEQGFEEKDVWLIDLPYLNLSEALTSHEKFKAVYEKMKFPSGEISLPAVPR